MHNSTNTFYTPITNKILKKSYSNLGENNQVENLTSFLNNFIMENNIELDVAIVSLTELLSTYLTISEFNLNPNINRGVFVNKVDNFETH